MSQTIQRKGRKDPMVNIRANRFYLRAGIITKFMKICMIRLVGMPNKIFPRKKMEAELKMGTWLLISTGS